MSKSRHTEAQMIGALKQLEAGRKAEDVARVASPSRSVGRVRVSASASDFSGDLAPGISS